MDLFKIVIMADIDDYSNFLDKRNEEKRKKLELEKEKERILLENKKKLEQWKVEFDKCSSIEDFRQYVFTHADDINNPYLQKAESKCCQEDSRQVSNTTSKKSSEDNLDALFIKIVAVVIICIIGFGIKEGLKSPEKKPFPPLGYIYCGYCGGTGYNYKYFWGLFSKKCYACFGSGYKQKIFIPSLNNSPTFKSKSSNQEWYDYYIKKANEAYDNEKWHYDRAAQASARGDEAAAKDHIKRAKAYHDDAEKHMNSAKLYE